MEFVEKANVDQERLIHSLLCFYLFVLAASWHMGFPGQDQIEAAAGTSAAAAALPGPLILWPGIKPVSWRCLDATGPIVPQQELPKSLDFKCCLFVDI